MSTREQVTASNGSLNNPDLEFVNDHVLRLRDAMWLGEWAITVQVVENPGGEHNNLASVMPVEGQYRASIEISPNAADDPVELHRTLIHELLHLAHRNQTDVIRLTMSDALGRDAYQILWETFRQQTELMVENLATVLVPLLPSPPSR